MKYLLILLAFNLQAMTIDQIDSLVINYESIGNKITPDCKFSFPKDEARTYENMSYEVCEKPSLEDFHSEFEKRKDKLRTKELARLAEAERVEALQLRIDSLSDYTISRHKCGYKSPYGKKLMMKIIKENDISKIECMESKEVEVVADIKAGKDEKKKLKDDRKAIKDDNTINPALKRAVLHLMKAYK